MKRILSLILMTLILTCGYVNARCIYDSTGRKLIYDDTIRGRQRAAKAKMEQEKRMQAAAAAKIDYVDSADTTVRKSNYIQSKNGTTRLLPASSLKSNYIQRKEP